MAVREPSSERIVVVSPHLDDGVLSLGASMSRWAREGASVELVTVLAGDLRSSARAGGWDARGGFETEGEAARARRDEDTRACAVLGVVPRHLDYGYQDYERHGDDAAVQERLAPVLSEADAVLLPGAPLTHPDHEWVARLAIELPPRRLGLYLEQPYGRRTVGAEPPGWVERALGRRPAFAHSPSRWRDRVAKWRATRSYASQLPLLALTGRRAVTLAMQPERIAWIDRARD